MAEMQLPNCFQRYLRYAIATDFRYFEFFDDQKFKLFLLVEFKDAKNAHEFEQEMQDDNLGIEFGPTDPKSRYATMRGFKAAVSPTTFHSWNDHVDRVELSLPVKPTAPERINRADLRHRSASAHPTDLLIGVIDDGCPFAAAQFVKFISGAAAGTRVLGVWDQNPDREPIVYGNAEFGRLLPDFNYGLEFLRDSAPPGTGLRKIGLNE